MAENKIFAADDIPSRIARLRKACSREGIYAYMVPTADCHNSEYVDDHFKCREYLSGFTGSNGTLVVTPEEAGLWTDGRYFIQAEKELAGSGIDLYRMGEPGVPKIVDFLKAKMPAGSVLGFDGNVVTAMEGQNLERMLAPGNISLKTDKDLAEEVWTDRPGLPCHEAYFISDDLAGESPASRIGRLRAELEKKKCQSIWLSRLDDIAWLLNIRGADIECNPVALAYLYLSTDRTVLFIQKGEVTESLEKHLDNASVEIYGYEETDRFITDEPLAASCLADTANISYRLFKKLSGKTKLVISQSPTTEMKAAKNETELKNIRETYIRDSAALTRYIYWLKNSIGKIPLNEYTAAMKLDSFRRELPGFIELSFPTIGAYKENGAIIHYEATADDNKELGPEGMYMVDSGGQYLGGTTDVTRTIVLGPVTDEMKKCYTLTLMGMLRLADARFLKGCAGRNLDILARGPLWKAGLDFKHGTGHGIGYILNVHEGPQNIGWRFVKGRNEAELVPGMIVSDEPGIYIEGRFGLRIENILEVVKADTEGNDEFLEFAHLTYVPLDPEAIEPSLLTSEDCELLNAYNKMVYEKILPFMETEEEKAWLGKATAPIFG